MSKSFWEDYITDVLSQVKFQYDHPEIRQELEGHFEDRYEALLQGGTEETIAQKRVLECMGNAHEVGKALNQEHSPILGWLWRVSTILAGILVFFSLFSGPKILSGVLESIPVILGSYPSYEDSVLVQVIEIDHLYQDADAQLYLDSLYCYEDGTFLVNYTTTIRPLSKYPVRHLQPLLTGLSNGLAIPESNSGYSFLGGRYYRREYLSICLTPPIDQLLISINPYREIYLIIDLTEGSVISP